MNAKMRGSHKVSIVGNVITVTIQGSLNFGATQKYISDLDNAITKLSPTPYFMLLDLAALQGATPDAWEFAKQYNMALADDSRLKGKAVVSSLFLIEKLAGDVNAPIDRNLFALFDDREAARQWLESKGAKFS